MRKEQGNETDEMLQSKIIVIVRLGDRIETKMQRLLIDKSTDQEKGMIMGRAHTP
jgi:hypothetical protein